MKEKDILKKLTLLQQMHPKQSVLDHIKRDVYAKVKAEGNSSIRTRVQRFFMQLSGAIAFNRFAAYSVSAAFVLVVLASTSFVMFPTQTHTVILQTRLTTASNQYDKARIALSDTKDKFHSINTTDSQELSKSLALTNDQLDNLKLKGEAGKYTAQECNEIYRDYLTFLENKEKSFSANSPSLSSVKSQIRAYEEQAEKRLHMYHSL